MKINIKYFQNHLLKSELLRNASILVTGTVLAQIVSLLLQPVTRRFFPPEAFGIWSVYLSIIGMITVVSSFRFDDAIVIPKNDKESVNLIGLSLIFNFFINILLFLVAIILGGKIISFLNLPEEFPVPVLYIVPVGAFLFNTYQGLNFWLVRKKKYYSVSANKLTRRCFEGAAQVSFGLARTLNGLIYSDLIGQIANVTVVLVQTFKNGLRFNVLSINKLKYVFKKYSEFPRYNLIPAFMSSCSYFIPPIFINKFFSPGTAGIYDASKTILSIPLALVAASFSSVLLQKISEKIQNKESFLNDLKPVLLVVIIIASVEILGVFLFGDFFFKIYFGNRYILSGQISKILVWSFALNFIVASFSTLFVTMRKIKVYSVWQFFYFLSIMSLVFFRHLNFEDFLKVYVGIEVVCYLAAIIVMIFLISRFEGSLETKKA